MPVDNPDLYGNKPYKKRRRKPGQRYVGEIGNSGLPGRRGKHEDYSDILKSIYGMTTEQVKEWANDPARNQFELIVASWIQKARKGDMPAIKEVLERLAGKVKDTLQIIEDAVIDIEGEEEFTL